MREIVWLPETLDDLQRLHEFIAEYGVAAAALAISTRWTRSEASRKRGAHGTLNRIIVLCQFALAREAMLFGTDCSRSK